jgi:elongation factor Ts
MATITAALVKELRESSGAGMMDCKKALTESDGDLAAAADWLRQKGLSAAAKKSGRVASEGLVGVAVSGTAAALVEVNSETDFVARNETFKDFVGTVAELAIGTDGDIDGLNGASYPGGERNVGEELTQLIATIGENMNLRRAATLSVDEGAVGSYLHNAEAANLGKIGVIVALKSSGDADALAAFGKQVAMQIAAAQPQAITQEELDPAVVEHERNFLIDQAKESGRPDNIIEKMVEGRMRKFFEESVLLSQTWVIDGESKVADVVAATAKELGAEIEIAGFERFVLGEGIEKKEEDFAAEVAAAAGS